MKNGLKRWIPICTSLSHAICGRDYIDRKFADRAPIGLNRHKRDLGVQVEGKVMPRPTPEKPILRCVRSVKRF